MSINFIISKNKDFIIYREYSHLLHLIFCTQEKIKARELNIETKY